MPPLGFKSLPFSTIFHGRKKRQSWPVLISRNIAVCLAAFQLKVWKVSKECYHRYNKDKKQEC